ncbi:MAG: ABC transporter substrate-binding protein [Chloroflexota bacterium]|nr:MAG: ABC transporter substrate-binding protein [Chloroflexota bacterium]
MGRCVLAGFGKKSVRGGARMHGRTKGLFLVPILVAILLVGALGGGCTSNTPATSGRPTTSTSASPSGAEQPTGELKIATGNLGKEMLDPTLDAGSSDKAMRTLMFDFLVGSTVDGQLSKDYGLARDWKVQQSGNSSVYTFDLRQGVKFHDGTEVAAEDVKFSLEYFTRKESSTVYAAPLRDAIDRIEVPSQYQMVVYTKMPYAFLLTDLSSLGYVEGIVLPKAYIEKNETDYFNKNPIGTGPYRFREQKRGTSITFEAIDYRHWLQQPRYKTVTLMLVPEESTRIAMLKTKEADVIDSVSRANISSLETAGLWVVSKKGNLVVTVQLGQTWDEGTYLHDVRVREALNLAVDRQAILDQVFKKAGSVTGSSYYGSWAYGYRPMPLYDYDPAKAKSLLEQAIKDKGWSKVELTFHSFDRPGVPELPLVAEAMAGEWQKTFGDLINVQVVPLDFAVVRQRLVGKKAPNSLAFVSIANKLTWNSTQRTFFVPGGLFTLATTPDLTALLDKLQGELDMDKVGQLQNQSARYIRDNHFAVPLFELDELQSADPKKVPQWDMGKFVQDPNYRDIMVRGRAYPAQ